MSIYEENFMFGAPFVKETASESSFGIVQVGKLKCVGGGAARPRHFKLLVPGSERSDASDVSVSGSFGLVYCPDEGQREINNSSGSIKTGLKRAELS